MNLRAKAILAIGLIAVFSQTLLATITYIPSQPKVNQKIAFVVRNLNGVSENRAQWNFGDGTPVSWGASTIAHTYKNPGTYTVKASYRTRKAVLTTDQISITIHADRAERVVSLVPLQISSVKLRFEDGKTHKIVVQNSKFLVAYADIKYKGKGTLRVQWLVDGKSFKTLSYSLPSSDAYTIDSGRIPGLPTQAPDSHRVSLKILQPSVDIFIPTIVYDVMRIDLGKLIRPQELLTLSGKVIDSSSKVSLAGATVEFREVDSATGITQPQAITASTDSQGNFAFKKVKANSGFELSSYDESHKISKLQGKIADKSITDFIIELEPLKREADLAVEDFSVIHWYQKTDKTIDFEGEIRIRNVGNKTFDQTIAIALEHNIQGEYGSHWEGLEESLGLEPGEEKVVTKRFTYIGEFDLEKTHEISVCLFGNKEATELVDENSENNCSKRIAFTVDKAREVIISSILPEKPCPGEKVTIIGQDFLRAGEAPESGEVWLSSSREFDSSRAIKVEKIYAWEKDRIEFLLPENTAEGMEQNIYLFQNGERINPYWKPFYSCLRRADLSVEDFKVYEWHQKTDRGIDFTAEITIKNIGNKTFDQTFAIALWHNIQGESGSHWEGLEESLRLEPGEEKVVTRRFTYQGGFDLEKTHEISICLYGNKEATEWVDENSDNNCSKNIAFTVERSRKTAINAVVPQRPYPGEKVIFEGQDFLWAGEAAENGEVYFSFEEVFNPSTAIKVEKIDLWQTNRIEFLLPANLREATQYSIYLFQEGQSIKFTGFTLVYTGKRKVELSVEDFKVLEWYKKATSGIDFLSEVRLKNSGDRVFNDKLEIALWVKNSIWQKKEEVLEIVPGEEKTLQLRFAPQGGFASPGSYEISISIYLPPKWEYEDDSKDNNSSLKISFTIEGKPVIVQFIADPPRVKPGEYTSLKWDIQGELASAEIWMEGGQVIHKVTSNTGSFQVQISQAVLPRYFLTVRNNVGMDQKDLRVEVYTDKPVISQFFSDPTRIKIGESAKLNWEIGGNFDQALIISNPYDPTVGKVGGASGFMEVKPLQTTEYKLNVRKEVGVDKGWDEKIVKIEVYGDKPVIEYFKTNLAEISWGQYFKLIGRVNAAQEASVSPDIGKVWLNEAGEFETSEIRAENNIQYVLVATGPGGVSSASVEVRVKPSIFSFGPDKLQVECGDPVMLYWNFKGASEGVIEPGPLRAHPPEGFLTVNPQETTTFTLKVSSAGGLSEISRTVLVRPKIDRFDALPPIINIGDISELRWYVLGAKEVTIDPDVGNVNLSSGSVQIRPLQETAYTLTAKGAGETTSTQYAKVKVTISAPVIRHFSADQITINRGQSTVLKWEVDYTVSARIEPEVGEIKIPPKAGAVKVSPVATTIYILTATNTKGSNTQQVTITVKED